MNSQHTIDRSALDQLLETVGGDESFLAELIQTFLEEAPRMLAEIRQALGEQDAEHLRRAAHSLKSNAAQFGAGQLQALSLQIEQLGKADDLDRAAPLIGKAEAEFQTVRTALESTPEV